MLSEGITQIFSIRFKKKCEVLNVFKEVCSFPASKKLTQTGLSDRSNSFSSVFNNCFSWFLLTR